MKDMCSPTGWENAVDCGNALDNEYPFTLKKTAPQPSPAAQGDAIEHELAMLIRRIVSSARRNCEDGSNVLKLANEAWAYLVRKGLNGSPLRDAGIESDPTPPAKAADSVNQNNLENLLELIDNFAETRHTCGHWTYNLKSNEARQKIIAALKGEV